MTKVPWGNTMANAWSDSCPDDGCDAQMLLWIDEPHEQIMDTESQQLRVAAMSEQLTSKSAR